MARHAVRPGPPPGGDDALARLGQLRRRLGVRFYRPIVLLRGPLRVTFNLALHPSLSLHRPGWTINLNRHGVDMRLAPAPGLAYRRRMLHWPRPPAGPGSGRGRRQREDRAAGIAVGGRPSGRGHRSRGRERSRAGR